MSNIIIETENDHIVFSIPIPGRSPVFMSVEKNRYDNDKRGIVIVDTERFLELWKKDPTEVHFELSHGTPNVWRNDHKYNNIETLFSCGKINPVLLPRVYCRKNEDTTEQSDSAKSWHVRVDDGVTRIIWLLYNKCPAFPVECGIPGAAELYAFAAMKGSSFFTASDKFK